jgi:hypothetical protein
MMRERKLEPAATLADNEPTQESPTESRDWSDPPPPAVPGPAPRGQAEAVVFDRTELRELLDLYGRKVAAGEWRDYAIDFMPHKAVFSVFRRASEYALYRIEKTPRLTRRQGAYAVVASSGLILKRGHDLRRVIAVLDKKLKVISG